ncbi:hypothetical protein [Palleronia caenipelagi]|uniref:Uncharacterized protein n=1 Tax=Palleronia caenipelagi TaxID=2489174 RepID=A0A547Q672_9RHOB|nr:hypothetical protein [Palleronia caenipelagi]TRD21864.1 hypothetical protein FEV53_07375 [Palleronia caenipelagi]
MPGRLWSLALLLAGEAALAQASAQVVTAALPEPDSGVAQEVVEVHPEEALLGDRIIVTALPTLDPDRVGLAQPAALGLPDALWSRSSAAMLSALLETVPQPTEAATMALLRDALSVGDTPPDDSDQARDLFLARVDTLVRLGDLSTASALLKTAGLESPELFMRWANIALMTGRENAACQRIGTLPPSTSIYPARVFCHARQGDWPAAVITLETGVILGEITPAQRELMLRFLDEEHDGLTLPPPRVPTPFEFVIYEALGEPLRTAALPIAFAHADLREIEAMSARIAAAERLARHGAIPPERLMKLYLTDLPASGETAPPTAEAVQQLEKALDTGDLETIETALQNAATVMGETGLLPFLAESYGAAVAALGLETSEARQLDALATGIDLPPLPAPSPRDAALIADGRPGEALLRAVTDLTVSEDADTEARALSTLMALGLENRARRIYAERTLLP